MFVLKGKLLGQKTPQLGKLHLEHLVVLDILALS